MPKRKWDGMIDRIKKSMTHACTQRKRPMDTSIWSRLPRDIQQELITLLPIPTLCRFRSLSKDWHAAILQQQSRKQWYISLGNSGKLQISPDGISWKVLFTLPLPKGSMSTCSAGLVLAFCLATENFVVLNPMLQSRQELLPRLDEYVIFTAIQSVPCSSETLSYIVVAVTSMTVGDLRMHLYDSRAAAWLSAVSFPVPDRANGELFCCATDDGLNNCMLLQDDHLYFFTISPGNVTTLKSFNVWNPKATLQTVATWTSLPLGFERQPSYEDAACFARSGYGCARKDMSLIFCGGDSSFWCGKILLGMMDPSDDLSDRGSRRFGFVYLDEESRSWQAMTSLSLGSVFSPEIFKKSPCTFMLAAGNNNSTEVTLLFHYKWGCVLDLASGTWRANYWYPEAKAYAFLPFYPSFQKF
ncbi:hypothetical protein SELMODRAFT_415748 [Selaginella moellendorffii]|uniref:F-box domain-containing protein n=1 Tax=Selaginella moellendorffii TaxID=88036 RepID=D8RX43_SELML|nr:hypothetical protein SELMODRAFT_415748 [Selaginella moellendorffii]